jgi:chemotaxis family two-component system response regulator PixG
MTVDHTALVKVYQILTTLQQKAATGQLVLTTRQQRCCIYLYQGAIAYAIHPQHRVRRWHRAIKKHHCTMPKIPATPKEPWEYYYLLQGVAEQTFSITKAQRIIESVFYEILVAMTLEAEVNCQWKAGWEMESITRADVTLPIASLKPIFNEVREAQAQWHSIGLTPLDLYSAPSLLTEPELDVPQGETVLKLQAIFNGQRTIWDLMVILKQSFVAVTRLLDYYLKQGLMKFHAINDCKTPVAQTAIATQRAISHRPLVVCIDDSPQVCYNLEQILTKLGFRSLCISDPVQALPTLMQHQPDLLLIDLVMPVMNGYELCSHLRRVPSLQNVPVVLMTGSKSIVDYVRAKMVGANELLLKPLKAEGIETLTRKYLLAKPMAIATPKPKHPIAPSLGFTSA